MVTFDLLGESARVIDPELSYVHQISKNLIMGILEYRNAVVSLLKMKSVASHPHSINIVFMKVISILLLALLPILGFTQETYRVGSTEYYHGQTYSTTGKPLVKRSAANKAAFLRSKGHDSVPVGYEVDHIIPLSEGGSDDPSNMQLLTIDAHNRKTARERASNSNSTYQPTSYTTSSTYTSPNYIDSGNKTIYTGPNGGKYYINSNGNKTYLKSSDSNSSNTYSPKVNSYSSTCGALTKSGTYCKRVVSGGGRCYQHN